MINISEIERFLDKEHIDFKRIGHTRNVAKFCSLKCVEDNGLFFIVGNVVKNFVNSIILCDNEKENIDANNTYIIVKDPQLVFYKLMNHYYPKKHTLIHSTAVISDYAKIGKNVSIGAHSYVGDAIISTGTIIKENVVIHDNVYIGNDSIVSASSVIGADGIAWIWDQDKHERIIQPQIGGVHIGKKVLIGSNVTIVKGSVNENTIINDGTLISHGSQIGHGVVTGKNVHIANNVTIAGNVELKNRVFVGAGAVIVSQKCVAEGCIIGAGAVISRNIDVQGSTLVAMPARAIPSTSAKLNGVPRSLKVGKGEETN